MAKTLLFQFWVKPSGIFASKRYANVFVDDNGIVTTENVPGKEAINLPSVDDYKSTNYPYAEGNDISEFCNTTTFTKYHLYASRTTPWAYTTTLINAPECGYLTPLPTPAVPPNPYGTATYDVFAFMEFCDNALNEKLVKIYRKHGAEVLDPIELEYGGKSPVVYSYTAGDNKFSPIRTCECEFNFIALENFPMEVLYTFDEREFLLEVTDVSTGKIDFKGFVSTDNSSEPFSTPPYAVSVRATDGIGGLKTISYPMPVGSSTDIKQKFLYMIAYALSKTNLDLDIMTMCNLYATGMENGLDNDPVEMAQASPLRMTNSSGDVYTCYEALEAICLQFGACLSQVNGQWRFARVTEMARGTARYRLYDYTGRFKLSGTLATTRLAGNNDQEVIIRDNNSNIIQMPPYKLVRVVQEFGRAPDVIYNGDFEQWDGQNFNYWTRYGAISVSRVQKSVTSSAGTQVLVDDYACRFNERANSGKWLEDSPIWMNKGQTAKLSLNIGKTDALYDFKVRFTIGQYYLTNDNGTFEWVAQLATTTIRVDNRAGDIFSFAISIEIPEAPISGDMIVQFYGFVQLVGVSSVSTPPGGARPTRGSENGVGGTVVTYYEVDAYTPIDIDNIAITSTVDTEDSVTGIINVSSQNSFFTNKPDDIKVIWGEYREGGFDPVAVSGSFVPARPTRGDEDPSVAPQKQLQTIYLPNGSLATGWYEYGESSSSVLMGLCLARAVLKAYQTPYKQFNGAFLGASLNYFDTFNIVVDSEPSFSSKIFMWQDATFDVKEMTANGKLVEIFSKNLISNDYSSPQIGTTSSAGFPPIVQNPNIITQLNSIFTEQFTPEFT